MSREGKAILESTLGKLLGFDDGAADVLDHLVTIESKEARLKMNGSFFNDLSEYLSQLLGNETPEISSFVENVGRFQRGEEVILPAADNETPTDDEKPTASDSATSNPLGQKQTRNQTNKKNKNNHQNNKQGKGRVPPPSKKAFASGNDGQSLDSSSPSVSKLTTLEVAQPPPPPQQETIPKIEKSRPTRGKATIVCGCFGTKHKALTNCLYCGRISCVEEGYDFCPFCGYMIEEIKGDGHGHEASWVQKERLLRFDREFARRTQIFDDQADFQAPATWMTEEERTEAEQKQTDRIESLKRPKQTLSLSMG
eukprot:scaffold4095_cov117-Cylindrotheca_fusiformis.AAC.21